MQSHEGFIRLLAALPPLWENGKICGLCARGGHRLDIYWKNSRLDYVVLYKRKGSACKIKYKEPISCDGFECCMENGLYSIDLSNASGDCYVIKCGKEQ